MTEESSRKFKILSFIFTVVIVLYHANGVFSTHFNLPGNIAMKIDNVVNFIATIAMAYFFMTSGFLLYRNATRENAPQKIKRRCISLLLPMFVWNCVYFAKEILTSRGNGMDLRAVTILYQFTFSPYDGPLWYIFAIFLLCLLIVPVTAMRKKSTVAIPFCAVFVCVLSVLIYPFGLLGKIGISEEQDLAAWIVRLSRYMPSYVLGCLIGLYNNQLVDYKIKQRVRWMAVLCSAAMLLIACLMSNYRFLRFVLMTALPVVIWLSVSSRGSGSVPGWIKASFLMYATHMLVNSVVLKFATRFFHITTNAANLWQWLLFLLVSLLCTHALSCTIAFLLHRFNLKRLKVLLTGDRI